jgi:shikimate kinase
VNVILTGMRGTGKSSLGAILAERLGFAFIDTDVAIETLAGVRIEEIVARHGWDHFRALERRVIANLVAADRQVIASGGGTLIDEENAARLKAQGIVILLVCALPILQQRIAGGRNRPSLTGHGSAVAELEEVWQARRARYAAVADLTYDVSMESDDPMQDLQRKTAAIHALLLQTARFTAADIQARSPKAIEEHTS